MIKRTSRLGIPGVTLLLLVLLTSLSAGTPPAVPDIPKSLKWSERMALSIIKNNPEPWMIEFSEEPVWSYPQGLVLHAFEEMDKQHPRQQYRDYIKAYPDVMLDEKGNIRTYDAASFNIDMVNSGKILFNLYKRTKDEKYKVAIETLRHQMKWQPRTTEGGYWHKLRYPWQMWLDGAYMGAPFLAQYGKRFGDNAAFDEVANQLVLLEKKTRDARTGLLYHGWDESRFQPWANPKTGTSPHFWGRAMGWYAMALVDVLDFFPQDHPRRNEIIGILQRLAPALQKYQDAKTGLWYQVVDQGAREGNYLEASASSMFVYALAKGANKGYLDKQYRKVAGKGFKGIIDNMIEVKPDGEVLLHKVCAVAGLGGNPYRDGTYEYYVNEPIRTNDPKGTGPFILASLELDK
ncbi:glycoside hydrolase family 88 protein [Pontibacter diazotrophicus]|uniref:Glycoside hydrolase family 88 protein n=1 Tax=Pontibacter diazotrophicus TaxID=1400979 RepID=A0A3D8LDS2_9BACT|nr:glycoside hydrolase family 88 protein [Pontibacter diazotrophicus]RDV15424.1 glycoside hydrolase family 88 protein [Pontibacter diazotrophicus]